LEVLYPFPGNLLTHRQDQPHQKLKLQPWVMQEKQALCAETKQKNKSTPSKKENSF
jgi:hypothetical protein